ncbi:hypothetical protein H257_04953 [Aphanomyces astaci]|uniref:Uncharacterized protein n=1 Tax=Aphanomyces astaci TaxID=112090 RepID=W4GTM4_APHAT|nr:hypothetical protein H257_04953 [Aphanomyces astaci]ETV82253.1 hypothetical protein H257_04953 [Aphanomyces astaci]|eukprot:XP_009827922.1 hypothetical protein H257_04953 [Aphanomyces astaci]
MNERLEDPLHWFEHNFGPNNYAFLEGFYDWLLIKILAAKRSAEGRTHWTCQTQSVVLEKTFLQPSHPASGGPPIETRMCPITPSRVLARQWANHCGR